MPFLAPIVAPIIAAGATVAASAVGAGVASAAAKSNQPAAAPPPPEGPSANAPKEAVKGMVGQVADGMKAKLAKEPSAASDGVGAAVAKSNRPTAAPPPPEGASANTPKDAVKGMVGQGVGGMRPKFAEESSAAIAKETSAKAAPAA
jgi:hypothetical protein